MSRDLLQRIENLPKSLQVQVIEFIEFLLAKNSRKPSSKKSKSKNAYLNYNKYKFREKDLKFNRDEINER